MLSANMLASVSPQRPERSADIDAFLSRAGFAGAQREHLAGDASFRRYERIRQGGGQWVLMDAPPPWEDVRPFIQVTRLLRGIGLNAPDIIAVDEEQGFLLLEDLGDASFSRVLRQDVAMELELYATAIDALAALQTGCDASVISGLPLYDEAVYLREVALFPDWFLPQVVGREEAARLRAPYMALWSEILGCAGLQQTVLVHRDYHADNLLWLPGRQGVSRVGMLDYQDALLGDPLYDVVSLLEDARRDVAPSVVARCYTQFLSLAGEHDVEEAGRRYAVLGAQRNLKIIGIFARLCVRDGKPHYLSYLPRVWGHLVSDMGRSAFLSPLADFIDTHVPPSARGVIEADPAVGGIA